MVVPPAFVVAFSDQGYTDTAIRQTLLSQMNPPAQGKVPW